MLLPSGSDTVREFLSHGTQFGPWSQSTFLKKNNWRREWDSNPRAPCRATRFRGELFRPLRHLSTKVDGLATLVKRGLPLPQTAEKVLEYLTTLVLQNATRNIWMMIPQIRSQKLRFRHHGSALWIPSAEIQVGESRQHDSPRAHGTRLQCDIDVAFEKSPTAESTARLFDGHHLGVRNRAFPRLPPIVRSRHHPLLLVDHDAPDWHFPVLESPIRLLQCLAHVILRVRFLLQIDALSHDAPYTFCPCFGLSPTTFAETVSSRMMSDCNCGSKYWAFT